MALPINVGELIENRVVESTRIEYKSDWDPEPIVHSITAFANDIDNSGGGYIVVGIAEQNGMPKIPISGLNKGSIDRIQKELLNKCNLIEPRYIPVVEPSTYDGKDILVIWTPGGDDRPYKCPIMLNSEKASKKSEKAYYIRKMANTIRANAREEQELISLSRDVPFDDRINPHADVYHSKEKYEDKNIQMKLKNVLIVVKDIERARRFYHDLFGFELVQDNDGNMILSDGLVLQDEKIWKRFLGKDIIPTNNACELYFEDEDIEGFIEKLEAYYPDVQYVNRLMTHSWGQKVIRFYDPDGNLIEVGTPM